MKTYNVLRQHFGDKLYLPGDEREATPADVAHLVVNGVLEEKSEGQPKNKAKKSAPKNKSEQP